MYTTVIFVLGIATWVLSAIVLHMQECALGYHVHVDGEEPRDVAG